MNINEWVQNNKPHDCIINCDCLEGMKQLEDNSIDTIITDPPYGLRFMGKKWDYDVPSIKVWKECLRVLKPGGTFLCFAGSRTQHRMAVNIEDAGFILKDVIMYIFGSGFPKATDISKQLDKGHKRKVIAVKNHAKKDFKDNLYAQADANKNNSKVFGYGKEKITLSATPEAKLWSGYKSHGLKPAYEPILITMKPNDGTYANNALRWGVSGLNIDGGRVPLNGELNPKGSAKRIYVKNQYDADAGYGSNKITPNLGRYPANVILDEVATKMLDKQSGISKSTGGKSGHTGAYSGGYKEAYYNGLKPGLGDKGGASRFFYCAKASKAERNAGCKRLMDKGRINYGGFHSEKGLIENNRNPENRKPMKNNHPTVKPIALMEYLCTLTKTPSGGIVLDPFMGSGTTALACRRTNRPFIGFEIDKEYCAIAKARLGSMPKSLDYFVNKKEE